MTERAADAESIEGARAVTEALRAGRRRVLEIRVAPGPGSRARESLLAEARRAGVAVRTDPALGRGRAPRVLASAEPFPEAPFETLLDRTPRRLVALDRVTDVGNLGSIARSAEVAGASGLVLELRGAPAIGGACLRASAGALEHLAVGRTPRLAAALELARSEGVPILAADPAGEPLERAAERLGGLAGDWLWLFGSEERGLRRSLLDRADHVVAAPQRGRTGSLGVAAAAAYLLLRTAEISGS